MKLFLNLNKIFILILILSNRLYSVEPTSWESPTLGQPSIKWTPKNFANYILQYLNSDDGKAYKAELKAIDPAQTDLMIAISISKLVIEKAYKKQLFKMHPDKITSTAAIEAYKELLNERDIKIKEVMAEVEKALTPKPGLIPKPATIVFDTMSWFNAIERGDIAFINKAIPKMTNLQLNSMAFLKKGGLKVTGLIYALMLAFNKKEDVFFNITIKLIMAGANVNIAASNGNTPLLIVAKNCNFPNCVALARSLIDKGANVNAKDLIGKTALDFASANKNAQLVDLLIANGAKRNLTIADLFNAIDKNDIDLLKEFVKENKLILHNKRIDTGETALIYAAHLMTEKDKPLAQLIEFLVISGSNVNAVDYYGNTALMYLVQKESIQTISLIRFLIDHHANVTLKNSYGKTAIDIALEKGNNEIVKILFDIMPAPTKFVPKDWFDAIAQNKFFLVKKIISIMEPDDLEVKNQQGDTGLIFSVRQIIAQSRHIEFKKAIDITRVIINSGANINAKDKKGNNILMILVDAYEDFSIDETKIVYPLIELIIDRKIDLNNKNDKGDTVLDLAQTIVNLRPRDIHNQRLLQLLLEHGAKKSLNPENWQAAIRDNNLEQVKQFIEESKDIIETKFFNGETALLYATRAFAIKPSSYNSEIIKTLINSNANVNARDSINNTALIILAHLSPLGCSECIALGELLIKNNADINAKNNNNITALIAAKRRNNKEFVEMLTSQIENLKKVSIETLFNLETSLKLLSFY